MLHWLFTLLLSTTSICLGAQTATQIMARVNDQLAAVPQGAFHVKSYLKSINKTDTATYAGRVYFFRNEPFADSFCLFFIEQASEGILYAYDGQAFYQTHLQQKVIWQEQVRESGGIRKRLQKSSVHSIAYQGILNNTPLPAYPIDRFSRAHIDTLDGHLRITATEAFANPMKILSKDPDSGTTQWTYTLQLPDLALLRAEVWAIIGHKVQYDDYHLSDFHLLCSASKSTTCNEGIRKEKTVRPSMLVSDRSPCVMMSMPMMRSQSSSAYVNPIASRSWKTRLLGRMRCIL